MQDDGIELYRRFLDGDERGLEELIALYRHGLFRFIYGYVHDEALAEDLMQEVFIQLYFHRSFKERDDAGFKTYLYKIARNKSLNEIKKRKRKREVSLDALTEKNVSPVTSDLFGGDTAASFSEDEQARFQSAAADEALESKQRAQTVHTAINRLKEEYREVLLLRYFDDLPPEKIAKITKRKVKQVYNLLARGKIALKEELLAGGQRYEDI